MTEALAQALEQQADAASASEDPQAAAQAERYRQRFEIVLVNDGSVDDTPAKIAELAAADEHIVPAGYPVNAGSSDLRQRVLDILEQIYDAPGTLPSPPS